MKVVTAKALFSSALIAGALFAAAAEAQTRPVPRRPAPTDAANVVEGVVVVGRQRPITHDRLRRLNRRSASSCFFDPRYNTHLEDYLGSLYGTPPINGDLGTESRIGDYPGEVFDPHLRRNYYNINGPLGDASNDYYGTTIFGDRDFYDGTGGLGACEADLRFAAGRAHIARRDRKLPEAFALYEAGRYPEALEMFRKAYNKLPDSDGGVEAALMIGKIQLLGQAGQPNTPEALMWLRRAAGSAVPYANLPPFNPADPEYAGTAAAEAAMILGRVYLHGYRTPKDAAAARKWFARAEYVGHVPAAKVLGDLYYQGVDSTPDAKRAARHYTKAASYGFAPAQYALAEIKSRGEDGARPDLRSALAWYGEAARRGHPDALHALAVAHERGNGVPADPQKALGFYKDAALAGSAAAQGALGTYFYKGELVARDHATARKWFEVAAVGGDPEAMFNLAVMLSKGEGGEVDLVKAWVWFKLAETLERENAGVALSALERRMTAAQRQAAQDIVSPKTPS